MITTILIYDWWLIIYGYDWHGGDGVDCCFISMLFDRRKGWLFQIRNQILAGTLPSALPPYLRQGIWLDKVRPVCSKSHDGMHTCRYRTIPTRKMNPRSFLPSTKVKSLCMYCTHETRWGKSTSSLNIFPFWSLIFFDFFIQIKCKYLTRGSTSPEYCWW